MLIIINDYCYIITLIIVIIINDLLTIICRSSITI